MRFIGKQKETIMDIYIIMLLLIFSASAFCYFSKHNNSKNIFLLFSFFLIFLVYALRAPTVGRDVIGYKEMYDYTFEVSWENYDYVYFESGYVFLMKVFTKLQLPFQFFLAFVSALTLIPVFVFTYKYSKNYFFSVIIYICYIFFEFYLTGLRQAIAMSIALMGLLWFIEAKKCAWLKYLLVIGIAALFHKSALICLLFLPLSYIKKMSNYMWALGGIAFLSFFCRKDILLYIKDLFEKGSMNENAETYIGLNFYFIIGVSFLMLLPYLLNSRNTWGNAEFHLEKADEQQIKFFLLGIIACIIFGTDTGARSYMFFSLLIFIQLPNTIHRWKSKERIIFEIGAVAFFVVFFFTNTLLPNDFDIVPYSFFWDNN